MKVIKTMAYLFGAVSLIFGATSCNKDEDKEKCCTFTYDNDPAESICEDSEEFKGYVADYGWTWEQYATLAAAAGELNDELTVSCN